MNSQVVLADSILDPLITKILSNSMEKPLLVDEENGVLADFPIFLNWLTILGGAPNVGKSSVLGQISANFLWMNPEHFALIANVEMYPEEILKRIISSIAGVDLSINRKVPLTEEEVNRIHHFMPTIASIAKRLILMAPPITMVAIAEAINQYGPTLVGVDYLQRVDIGGGIVEANERLNTSKKMSLLRQFTPGRHIIAIAALSRSAGPKGSNYKAQNLSMASFRESSEIEYACDSAYILMEDEEAQEQGVTNQYVLRHVKARYTERKDISLAFNGSCHRWSKPGEDDGTNNFDTIINAIANSSPESTSSKTPDLQQKLKEFWAKQPMTDTETA